MLGFKVRLWSLAPVLFAGLLAGCFTDTRAGSAGDRCSSDDQCGDALRCEEEFCIDPDCAAGSLHCRCDNGACEGELVCVEGVICAETSADTGGGSGGGVTSTASSATTMTATTVTPGCGMLGEGCENASDCCTDCMDCVSGACVAMIGEPGSCGLCQACNELGVCGAAPGMPCDGETIECSDFVFELDVGAEDVACLAFAEAEVVPVCNDLGQCQAATPDLCPAQAGAELARCDNDCYETSPVCSPGAVADNVTVATLCVTGTTNGCSPDCTGNQQGSQEETFRDRSCAQGRCQSNGVGCGNYGCDPLLGCRTTCTEKDHCSPICTCTVQTNMCDCF